MIMNLEKAGFDTDLTPIYWTFATGFPKASSISKSIDRRAGVEGEVIQEYKLPDLRGDNYGQGKRTYSSIIYRKTKPATKQAKEFDGAYAGFQPKPAVEVILVAMKPTNHGSYIAQALDNAKGVTYLDDCRIPYANKADAEQVNSNFTGDQYKVGLTWGGTKRLGNNFNQEGRFPGNLLVSDNVLADHSRFFSLDAWAEKNLPFLIVPKASFKEKQAGLEVDSVNATDRRPEKATESKPSKTGPLPGRNPHPTVKPIKLFSYLITMGSREGDLVLDPFCGTGTTCIAAKMLNRRYIGIELKQEYHEVAKLRLQHAEMKKTG
jgi:site-specific DNA-methyltransferase (adenine-specific)